MTSRNCSNPIVTLRLGVSCSAILSLLVIQNTSHVLPGHTYSFEHNVYLNVRETLRHAAKYQFTHTASARPSDSQKHKGTRAIFWRLNVLARGSIRQDRIRTLSLSIEIPTLRPLRLVASQNVPNNQFEIIKTDEQNRLNLGRDTFDAILEKMTLTFTRYSLTSRRQPLFIITSWHYCVHGEQSSSSSDTNAVSHSADDRDKSAVLKVIYCI